MVILVLRLAEIDNFCEKATTGSGIMASISGSSMLGTRNNDHLEGNKTEIDYEINKNENKDEKANAEVSTGAKNGNGGEKPSEEKEREEKKNEKRNLISGIKSPAGRTEDCNFPRLSKKQSTTKKSKAASVTKKYHYKKELGNPVVAKEMETKID